MDHEQPARGGRPAAAVRAPRRRLIKGAALAGPAILTLGTRRAWAVSSCGQTVQDNGNGTFTPITEHAASAVADEDGISHSCRVSFDAANGT